MSNPTLTWATHGPYAIAAVGSTPTVAELLTALNTQMANSSWWSISNYSAVNGTLELKRNSLPGAPAGELATVRILIMGGQIPVAAALMGNHAAGSAISLYGSLSVDANTTGPSASYASAAPYSTKYTRAAKITQPNADLTTANSPKLTIFEADDVFGFAMSDSTNVVMFVAGRILTRGADDSLTWGISCQGGAWPLASTANTMASASATYPIPINNISTTGAKGAYWDTVTASARQWGRTISLFGPNASEANLGASGLASQLVPIPCCECQQVSSPTQAYFGVLRQIRFGPSAVHLNKVYDSLSVLQGTHIFGATPAGIGIWLDELP